MDDITLKPLDANPYYAIGIIYVTIHKLETGQITVEECIHEIKQTIQTVMENVDE